MTSNRIARGNNFSDHVGRDLPETFGLHLGNAISANKPHVGAVQTVKIAAQDETAFDACDAELVLLEPVSNSYSEFKRDHAVGRARWHGLNHLSVDQFRVLVTRQLREFLGGELL